MAHFISLRYNFTKNQELPIRQLFIIVLLLSTLLHADEKQDAPGPYSVRIGYGFADMNDLGEILMGDWNRYSGDASALNIDGGYRISHDFYDLPLDFYVKGGISYFNENNNVYNGEVREDFLEATIYIKAYYKLDFWQNRIRIGLGEGLSLAQEIPIVEYLDATNDDGTVDGTAKFLNYLDISLDFDVGRLIRVKSLQELYLGYTLKHRSGIFGTFNGVHGGSNYNMVTLEKNF